MGTMDYVLGQLKQAKEALYSDPEQASLVLDRVTILFQENRLWFDKQVDLVEQNQRLLNQQDQRDQGVADCRRQLDAVMGERDTLRRDLSDMRAALAEVMHAAHHRQEPPETQLPLSKLLQERYHGHPRFFELIERMVTIHEAKNRDYAGGDDYFRNFVACELWGGDPFVGIMHKLTDKWSRVCTLTREDRIDDPAVTDETIENTFIDGANFYLIAQILLERRRGHAKVVDREQSAGASSTLVGAWTRDR